MLTLGLDYYTQFQSLLLASITLPPYITFPTERNIPYYSVQYASHWAHAAIQIIILLNKKKISSLGALAPVQVCSSHKWSVATLLDAAGFRTFPSSHKVLLLSTALKSTIISLHFLKTSINFLFYSTSMSLLRSII